MGSLGGWEIVILLVVVVALFGAKRLPDMARSIGQSARVFKGEMKGLKDDESRDPAPGNPARGAPQSSTRPATPAEPAALPPVDPQVNPATGTADGTQPTEPARRDADR